MLSADRGRLTSGRSALAVAAFLFPAAVLLLLFRIVPAAQVVVESVAPKGEWVGLDTFAFLLSSDSYLGALWTTLQFNLIINPLQIVAALAIALLLADGARLGGLWQSVLLLPVAVPLAVSSVIWGVAFRPDDGILNALLAAVGIPGQPWLTSPDQALWSIVILASWVGVGYWALFLRAGLHEISRSLVEAAAIDGAGYWQTLFRIRLPLLRRTLAFVLVADTAANVLLFAPVQILTKGGPGGSTNLVMFDVFRNAFTFGDLPLASAQTVILVIALLVIVAIQFALLNRGGEREA